MIARLALALALALALPACALAQLQLSLFDGTSEKPLAGVTDLGITATGDSQETRFHARNAGPSSISLQVISASGQSFSLSSTPPLPYILAPNNFVEFRVRFAPRDTGSYSAIVTVNNLQVLVRATAKAAPTVTADLPGPAPILTAGSPIDFGRVQKGQSLTVQFHITNTTSSPMPVSSVAVSGVAFRAGSDPGAPVVLAPGGSIALPVLFSPATAGQYGGALAVDDRSFPLTGIGFDPPFPKPAVTLSAPGASGAQQKVAVRFDAPSEVAGTGTLTLEFQPSPAGVKDDPAVRFVATGSRAMTFTVREGDSMASFGSQTDLLFQTGTTAGSIVFTAKVGDWTQQSTLSIPPAPVSIDTASGARRSSDLDVTIAGFDNTRTAGQFIFTFFDTGGNAISPGAIYFDASGDFKSYFSTTTVGGAFLVRVTFPVSGDASQISAVDVQMSNVSGAAHTQRLQFK